jgi:hypothetical protein
MPVDRIASQSQLSAKSLAWDEDDVVDVIGGRRWPAAGGEAPTGGFGGHPFDQLVVSPSGRYQVAYAERGTKAVLLDRGMVVVRELNRSYYHALDFDYPVALGRLGDGREILVHCPERYQQLEIEEIPTGRRLTAGSREPIDVFHSRLSVSPDGRHLLVAGWVWQPYGIVQVFDLEAALADPAALDGDGVLPYRAIDGEVESACWLDADRVVVAAHPDEPSDGDEPEALCQGQVGVWSLATGGWLSRADIGGNLGTMIAVSGDRIVSLYGHPRLVDPVTGEVVAEWPQVDTGRRSGSFGVTHVPTPTAAVHPDGTRLAVAQPDHLAVIQLPH